MLFFMYICTFPQHICQYQFVSQYVYEALFLPAGRDDLVWIPVRSTVGVRVQNPFTGKLKLKVEGVEINMRE
jgi:hypothetical protein